MNGTIWRSWVAAILINAIPVHGAELFHNGGTAQCTGCHTTPPELKGSDASSTCLSCHQAPPGFSQPYNHYVATDNRSTPLCGQLTPGGDFCWLKKNYQWSMSVGALSKEKSPGERHGHNIVALDFNFSEDTTLRISPGGTYPASAMSCISCHDPHGYYRRNADGTINTTGPPVIASGSYSTSPSPDGNGSVSTFRMLAGKGYQPKSVVGNYLFTSDPPAAVAPPEYNRPEENSDTRVAYGSGMSEWCANCHADFLSGPWFKGRHIAGSTARLTPEIIKNYNIYVFTGNLNGAPATGYTSMVPYEMGTSDYSLLKRVASINNADSSGPQNGANVMCLTCHRAHATGWDNVIRWNMSSAFIVYEGRYPGADINAPAQYAQGRLETEIQKTFYDRPASVYSPFQRSLCNKCHVED